MDFVSVPEKRSGTSQHCKFSSAQWHSLNEENELLGMVQALFYTNLETIIPTFPYLHECSGGLSHPTSPYGKVVFGRGRVTGTKSGEHKKK